MTGIVKKVLIVGGGFSGMSAAIELRKQGIETHLVEIDPDWQADGAGISIGGATLRAFRQLGILDAFLEQGSGNDGLEVMAPTGQLITTIPMPRFVDPEIPGQGAIMRPVLARIMSRVVEQSGTHVRLGQSYESIEEDEQGALVTFTDGSSDHFDLVIAADGLQSKTRKWLFPEAPEPSYSGQGVWRAVLPRPEGLNCTRMWVGEHLKAGINSMSKEQVYLFLTEDREARERIAEDELPGMLRQLLIDNFPAPEVQALAAQITADSRVLYRPLDGLLVAGPWHRGRVVLIGDTVHATTPHLASGACIGIEDAIVLVEELVRADSLEQALTAFQERRWERCRMVVENSGRLGEIEIQGGDKAEHAGIMRDSMMALRDPI
ncbi:FAD-dependent oxidoreductase [Parahaliea maris]|uniref:FAD-dependent oxidoreductase n=1 Tax=Parahaliea maris TaxID=2716870 RepID=A0A5C8ZWB2_9GAMM|nr:FAD-dependent oxidoreductase [Parahaliea maris]TXS91882.1 FAD-dependent oxidoreductase [Parahaliea maris]